MMVYLSRVLTTVAFEEREVSADAFDECARKASTMDDALNELAKLVQPDDGQVWRLSSDHLRSVVEAVERSQAWPFPDIQTFVASTREDDLFDWCQKHPKHLISKNLVTRSHGNRDVMAAMACDITRQSMIESSLNSLHRLGAYFDYGQDLSDVVCRFDALFERSGQYCEAAEAANLVMGSWFLYGVSVRRELAGTPHASLLGILSRPDRPNRQYLAEHLKPDQCPELVGMGSDRIWFMRIRAKNQQDAIAVFTDALDEHLRRTDDRH